MHILIVDDEPMVRSSIARLIAGLGEGYSVYEAEDGEDAITILAEQEISLIISDIRMPAIDGLQLADRVNRLYPNTRVVLLSGYSEFEYALSALRTGVHEYLLKPASKESIVALIRKVEEELKQEREQNKLDSSRDNAVLEKRVQELLYGLPVPYVDLELLPPHQSLAVFLLTADSDTLRTSYLRFAMKNVLEEVLRAAGQVVVTVEEGQLAAVVFGKDERLNEQACEKLSQEVSAVLSKFYKIKVNICNSEGIASAEELHLLYMECMRKLNGEAWSGGSDLQVLDQKGSLHRLVRTALKWMEEEAATDIALSAVADRLQVSPNYLSTLIKNETGLTFTQHLIRIRITRAKQLLTETQLKIYEICDQVGYTDQAYFSRLFKASIGVTPYEYREHAAP
jgi:two-component system response regulator YesN